MPRSQVPRILWMVLLQFVACAFVYGIILLILLDLVADSGVFFYDFVYWFVMPLVGLFASLLAVLRGLNPYLAWFAPGLSEIIAFFGLTGLLPSSPGMPMITMLMGFIGTAIGDELLKRRNKHGRG